MAKFYGKVGFIDFEEISPGVWDSRATEKQYSGDIKRISNRYASSMVNGVNNDLVINIQISIVADPFINEHFPSIKYVEYKGTKWTVNDVDSSKYPRLILTLGEVYTNGQQS